MATSYLDLDGLRYFYSKIIGNLSDKLKIVVKTSAEWALLPGFSSEPNTLYVYSDHRTVTKDGTTYAIPAFKLGDGNAYVVDLPFATVDEETFLAHVNNNTVHVTALEKQSWNNKITIDESQINSEKLIFTKL